MKRIADVTVWVVYDHPPKPYTAGAKTRFWRDAGKLAKFVADGRLNYPDDTTVLRTGPGGTFDLTAELRAAMAAPAAGRLAAVAAALSKEAAP